MATKLRCILLDDELPGLSYLKMLCEQLPQLEVVRAFADPEKFLCELPELSFDLCITDIEMPGMNGLELAQKLSGKLIIFTTAYKEYAADAFEIDAVDYLTKPLIKERLEKAVSKAVVVFENREKTSGAMHANTDRGKAILHFNQIVLLRTGQNDSRDKEALLFDGSRVLLKNISFAQLLEVLPASGFCRVSKKEIVSLRHLKVFTHDMVLLNYPNGDLPISLTDAYRQDFLTAVGAQHS